MKLLENEDFTKIIGGSCSCIHFYGTTPIPTPISTAKTKKTCKKVCCTGPASRFEFNSTLYKCYRKQADLNRTTFTAPTDSTSQALMDRGKSIGELVDFFRSFGS